MSQDSDVDFMMDGLTKAINKATHIILPKYIKRTKTYTAGFS